MTASNVSAAACEPACEPASPAVTVGASAVAAAQSAPQPAATPLTASHAPSRPSLLECHLYLATVQHHPNASTLRNCGSAAAALKGEVARVVAQCYSNTQHPPHTPNNRPLRCPFRASIALPIPGELLLLLREG